MADLNQPLSERLFQLISDPRFSDDDRLKFLVNSIDDGTADIEHLITFLDDAPSHLHRTFANEMKMAFEEVLRHRLDEINKDLQRDPIDLYQVLLDIYNIKDYPERLRGILTTNYDDYLEQAIISVTGRKVNFGINVESGPENETDDDTDAGFGLLKLHGSFSWSETLPVTRNHSSGETLWIPPGIQKAKQSYPFNILWGLARDMLSCDILRVIGCRLGPNDWDLISLLFAMCHVTSTKQPIIEVIDSPLHAEHLKKSYPYLPIHSILDVEPVGNEFVSDFTVGPPKPYSRLSNDERTSLFKRIPAEFNWFQEWLHHTVTVLFTEMPSIETRKGFVASFLESK